MMIPLRRYLIVKEHGRLTYPEGTACAEVLIAGEAKGTQAGFVFKGLFVGLGFKLVDFLVGAKLITSLGEHDTARRLLRTRIDALQFLPMTHH